MTAKDEGHVPRHCTETGGLPLARRSSESLRITAHLQAEVAKKVA
jgi:hypothetical protein